MVEYDHRDRDSLISTTAAQRAHPLTYGSTTTTTTTTSSLITVDQPNHLAQDQQETDANTNDHTGRSSYNDGDDDSETDDVEISTSGRWIFFVGWIFLSSISHICIGAHFAMNQYLNQEPKPPPYTLPAFGNLFILVVYSSRLGTGLFNYWFLNRENYHRPVKRRVFNVVSRLRALFTHWPFYIFVLSVGIRTLTKGLSLDYTEATYVQLVMLFTPFVIVILNALLFRKRKVRWELIGTLVVMAIGSFILLIGSGTRDEAGFYFRPHIVHVFKKFDRNDMLGLGFALISTVTLASKTVFLSHLVDEYELKLSCSNLFVIERLTRVVLFILPALFVGDLHDFTLFTYRQWIVFFLIALFNNGIGSFLDIYATAKLGSSIYGTLLPLRLVSTVFLDWLLLGQRVNNLFQLIGFAIIFSSLLLFMISTKKKDTEESFDRKPLLRRTKGQNMDPFSNLKLVY